MENLKTGSGVALPPPEAATEKVSGGHRPPLQAAAGFDGIIGNPPWEGFKPIRKEFAANFYRGKPQFSKMGMDGPTFDKWFAEELKDEPEFAARWREHEAYYERHKEFFGRAFQETGHGRLEPVQTFHRARPLARPAGRAILAARAVSGFQTDEGCADLRRWFITEHRLDELTSFENRGYTEIENGKEQTKHIFPDVDSRFKFGFFKVVKGATTPKDHAFDARFYLHDPKDAFAPPIRYSVEMIRRFSPRQSSVHGISFARRLRTVRQKFAANTGCLEDFGYQFRRELHMTGDSHFFRKLGGKKPSARAKCRLYEGKMIHQFDASFRPPIMPWSKSEVARGIAAQGNLPARQFVRDDETEKSKAKTVPETRDELEKLPARNFQKRRIQASLRIRAAWLIAKLEAQPTSGLLLRRSFLRERLHGAHVDVSRCRAVTSWTAKGKFATAKNWIRRNRRARLLC